MRKFRVLIHGQNLLTMVDGVRRRRGFYTTAFVEADTPADAKSRAIDVLRHDAQLHEVALNGTDDPLKFVAEEVREVESFDGVRLPRHGLVFYDD